MVQGPGSLVTKEAKPRPRVLASAAAVGELSCEQGAGLGGETPAQGWWPHTGCAPVGDKGEGLQDCAAMPCGRDQEQTAVVASDGPAPAQGGP